jgi:uncharacterized repeat protein (TIGR03803 family)
VKPKRIGHSIKLSLKSVIAFLFIASASLVGAQTLQTLCSFNSSNGALPNALTLGNDGNFYGTTSYGGTTYKNGSYGYGTVFKVTTNGTLTTLVSFGYDNGARPVAALTLGTDGNFYGTTSYEGGSYSYSDGTVFKVTTNGVLTTLVSFANTNGAYPRAALTLGNDGNFYGTTSQGGSGGLGTVFQVTTKGVLTTLVSFANTNGAYPFAGLTLGSDGNFYGTTGSGGVVGGAGTVFKVTTYKVYHGGVFTTKGTLTTLYSFTGGSDGAQPRAALTLGTDGNFYGTTYYGGSSDDGTVFKVTANGTLTTLYSFTGGSDGALPNALTLGNDGNFYGTTLEGCYDEEGTVFKVTTNGTLTTLVSFNLTNGACPSAALTLGTDGNFYGTTGSGVGGGGAGTVFRLSPPFVQPPTLALQLFSSGYPQLNLTGMLNNNFVVQYCTNLANPNWINLLSVTNLPSSPYQFLDPAGIDQPARFYRAFMQ